MSEAAAFFAPVTGQGMEVDLAMQRLWLTGEVLPVGARLTVTHTFQIQAAKPVEVVYSFPLPRDAALRRFRVEGDDFSVHSTLKETAAAVREYEEGVAQGSLSTLARQYRDGVINLSLGNLRPNETVTVLLEILAGVESRDDGFRFRFPFTLAPAYHPRAHAVEVAPGEGEIELPADEFGDVLLPRIRKDAKDLHEVGFDLIVPAGALEVGSPSHAVRVRPQRVMLATAHDVPNRDLVLDVTTVRQTQVLGGGGHFATVIPSTAFGANPSAPRRVVIVLDRSGSMSGEPIQQARQAIEACLGALSEADEFGILAFDNENQLFLPKLVAGSKTNRQAARDFLKSIDARGGTELAAGFLAAARMVDGPGDMLILTDGQVAGTETILENARKIGIRLHCLGIGSASQDRFLTLLARETGGVSRFVTPRERVDMAAVDLFASIGRPAATDLKAEGNVQPPPPSAVFAGTPLLLFSEGETELKLTWKGGSLAVPLSAPETASGETVRLLQGARRITDFESRYPAPATGGNAADRRQQDRVKTQLRTLSEIYGLASREMSLVSVVQRKGDVAGRLPETRIVAVGMPESVSFDAVLGLPASPFPAMAAPAPRSMLTPATQSPAPAAKAGGFRSLFNRQRASELSNICASFPTAMPKQAKSAEDELMELAAALEPDGGLPGTSPNHRIEATLTALLAYLAAGQTTNRGAFRSHVQRLVAFLNAADRAVLSPEQRAAMDAVLNLAQRGGVLPGDWQQGSGWKPILASVAAIEPRLL